MAEGEGWEYDVTSISAEEWIVNKGLYKIHCQRNYPCLPVSLTKIHFNKRPNIRPNKRSGQAAIVCLAQQVALTISLVSRSALLKRIRHRIHWSIIFMYYFSLST